MQKRLAAFAGVGIILLVLINLYSTQAKQERTFVPIKDLLNNEYFDQKEVKTSGRIVAMERASEKAELTIMSRGDTIKINFYSNPKVHRGNWITVFGKFYRDKGEIKATIIRPVGIEVEVILLAGAGLFALLFYRFFTVDWRNLRLKIRD